MGLSGASAALAQNSPSMNLEGGGIITFDNSPICSATSCPGNLLMTVSGVLGQQNVQNLNFTLNFAVPYLSPPTSSLQTNHELNGSEPAAKKPKRPTVEQQIEALQSTVGALQSRVESLQSEMGTLESQIATLQAGSPRVATGCLPAAGTGTSSDGAYTITLDGQFCTADFGNVEVLSGAVTIVSNASPMPPHYDVPWASGTLVASGWPRCCRGDYVPHISNGIIVSIVGALGQEYEGP